MTKWIVTDMQHLGGIPRVRDTRISVALILESLAAGMSVEDIVDAYPSLTIESVRGTLLELARLIESDNESASGNKTTSNAIFEVQPLKGHQVLKPSISQSDLADELFDQK